MLLEIQLIAQLQSLVWEYGDDINPYGEKDRVLVMINHQSTADVSIPA